jgi:hypothetical protein
LYCYGSCSLLCYYYCDSACTSTSS